MASSPAEQRGQELQLAHVADANTVRTSGCRANHCSTYAFHWMHCERSGSSSVGTFSANGQAGRVIEMPRHRFA